MTIVYEKILSETTSEIRYVVKEFKNSEEAGTYVEKRLEALERQGYTYGVTPKNGEIECYNEKARKYRVIAIAEKIHFISRKAYEAKLKEEKANQEKFDELLKQLGWDMNSLFRRCK